MVASPFSAVLFDLDGVLVLSQEVHLAAYQIVFERRGIALSAARYRELFGRSREQVIRAVAGDRPQEDRARMMAPMTTMRSPTLCSI